MGALVFAGVLDANGAGARKLSEQTSGTLHLLQLDVTDDEQIEAARRYICTRVADAGEPALMGGRRRPGCDWPLLLQVSGVWSTTRESSTTLQMQSCSQSQPSGSTWTSTSWVL